MTNGEMRVTVLFLDSKDATLTQNHYTVNGHSAGWQGAIAGSGFTKRNQPLVVPPEVSKCASRSSPAGRLHDGSHVG